MRYSDNYNVWYDQGILYSSYYNLYKISGINNKNYNIPNEYRNSLLRNMRLWSYTSRLENDCPYTDFDGKSSLRRNK